MQLALTAASLLLVLAASARPAVANCPGQEFVGVIDFTTRVTGAKSASAIGVNGYYRMKVGMDPGCQLKARLVKLGFGKTFFKKDQLQWGDFRPRTYTVTSLDGEASVLIIDASLASAQGGGLDIAVSLVKFDGDHQSVWPGFWRHLGTSWEKAGLWGGLEWTFADPDGPLASPRSPPCKATVVGSGDGAIPAFECSGLVIATNDLARALYATPALTAGAWDSFKRIARSGTFPTGGYWWDICTESISVNDYGPSAHRLIWVSDKGVDDRAMQPDAASLRTCGVRPAKPERAPKTAPRWQGGID